MSEYPADHSSKRRSATTSNFSMPVDSGMFAPPAQSHDAERIYRQLVASIFDFEKTLDDDHEIGARLASYSSAVSFYIQDVGYCDPHIITFSGRNENGEKLQLLQHVSQLDILFIEMKKKADEPVRIGFKLKREAEARR